jgi:tetratricopeptide (TPR) repeat protein
MPFTELERANTLRRSGQLTEALALIARCESRGEEERSRARALGARILLAQGDPRAAAEELRQTLEEAARLGRISDATADTFALAFIQIVHLNELTSARETLAIGEGWGRDDPGALGWHQHFSGLLALQMGDLPAARARFEQAAAYAARLDDVKQRRDSSVYLAQVAAEVGELRLATRLLEQLLATDTQLSTCERGPLHSSLAWIGMQGEGRPDAPLDIDQQLQQAREQDTACGNPFQLRLDALNLGLRALGRGDRAAAGRWLGELRSLTAGLSAALSLWEIELEARVALNDRRLAAALALFEREALLSEGQGNGDGLLRAQIGRGEVYERLGRLAPALAAFQSADELVSKQQYAFFAGSQRDGFLGRRDGAVRALVDALVRQGKSRDALRVAVRAFQRALGSFALAPRSQQLPPAARARWEQHLSAYQRVRAEIEALSVEDWRLDSSQIRERLSARRDKAAAAEQHLADAWRVLGSSPPESEPLPGEAGQVVLVVFPAERGWLTFTAWQSELEVERFEQLSELSTPSSGTARALTSVARWHESARELAVVPYGAAQGIDFAALPLAGQPLIESLPVRYRLALGRARQSLPPRSVAIVADPNDDLAAARVEAARVAESLAALPQHVLIGEQARREPLLDLLATASLFHYAGHALPAGGALNGLPLSGGGVLAPSDVLAARRVPEQVILAACDAASGEEAAWAGGWSLAHAFALAGAEEVVAALRKINDRDSARLMQLFYQALAQQAGQGAPSLASALQSAQRAAQREGLSDWQAFRVLSP